MKLARWVGLSLAVVVVAASACGKKSSRGAGHAAGPVATPAPPPTPDTTPIEALRAPAGRVVKITPAPTRSREGPRTRRRSLEAGRDGVPGRAPGRRGRNRASPPSRPDLPQLRRAALRAEVQAALPEPRLRLLPELLGFLLETEAPSVSAQGCGGGCVGRRPAPCARGCRV